ncbi:MAG: hypothetical protein ACKVS9_16485 [Phycisphaerae bacterium]
MKRFAPLAVVGMVAILGPAVALGQSQTAAFTYQGQLRQADEPVNGTFDAEFRLFDVAQNGTPIAVQAVAGVTFVDGLFTAALNFGTSAFNGQQRWVEIAINGETLTPRQAIASTPYAAFSLNTRGISIGAGNSIGIGTATPARTLHVAAGPDAGLRLQSTSAQGRAYDFLSGGDGVFRLNDGNNARLSVTSSGFVGVRTTTPDRPLSIAATDTGLDLMSFQVSSGNTRWFMSLENGGLNFGEAVAGDPTRMFFEPGGQIGIGTSNPTATLDVAGNVKALHVESSTASVSGVLQTSVLHITGGSDIAEPFNVNQGTEARRHEGTEADAADAESEVQSLLAGTTSKVEAGMVVSIDPSKVGELRIANRAYDTRVAGIISGANGVNVGLTLTQAGSVADGKHPVAMTGRVWCFVDADAGGSVVAGDLLTTSDTPGHAMRASDRDRAGGAIIGKAMSSLESGRGLVLVLVNLQ